MKPSAFVQDYFAPDAKLDHVYKSVLVQVHEEFEESVTQSYLFQDVSMREARKKAEQYHQNTTGSQAWSGDIFCADSPIHALNVHAINRTQEIKS